MSFDLLVSYLSVSLCVSHFMLAFLGTLVSTSIAQTISLILLFLMRRETICGLLQHSMFKAQPGALQCISDLEGRMPN